MNIANKKLKEYKRVWVEKKPSSLPCSSTLYTARGAQATRLPRVLSLILRTYIPGDSGALPTCHMFAVGLFFSS